MDIVRKLTETATTAHNECDLPLDVVAQISAISAQPESLQGKESLIVTLISQIEEYDPYAGIGCFGGGTSLDEIRRTLQALQN